MTEYYREDGRPKVTPLRLTPPNERPTEEARDALFVPDRGVAIDRIGIDAFAKAVMSAVAGKRNGRPATIHKLHPNAGHAKTKVAAKLALSMIPETRK